MRSSCEPVRLTRTHRLWLYGTFAVTAVSGLLWLAFHYGVSATGEFGPTRHPLESWWLRLHGGAAMVLLVILGTLLPIHVARAWRAGHNLVSGSLMLATMGALAATGYALYYIGIEMLRPWLSVSHWTLGVATLPLVLAHVWLGRSSHATDAPTASRCSSSLGS